MTLRADLALIHDTLLKAGTSTMPKQHEISLALQALERVERATAEPKATEAFDAVHSLSALLERHTPQTERAAAKAHWATLTRALSRLGTIEEKAQPGEPPADKG